MILFRKVLQWQIRGGLFLLHNHFLSGDRYEKFIWSLVFAVSLVFVTNSSAATLRMASHYPVEHLSTKVMHDIAEKIKKGSNGKFIIRPYPANQLGDYTLVFNEVSQGAIEIALIFIPSQLDSRIEMNSLPFIVTNYDDMNVIYAPGSNFYAIYDDLLKKQNIKLLGVWVEGFIGVGMTKPAVNPYDPNTSKERMIRVSSMEAYKLNAEAMGFSTTNIAYADLYPAMQTGVVDGWIGGTPTLNMLGFGDILKEYIPYNSMVESLGYIMNLDQWNALTPEDQKLFQTVFNEATAISRASAKELDADFMEQMAKKGIKIHTISAKDMENIATVVRAKTWPALEKRLGKDIMDKIREDIANLKK